MGVVANNIILLNDGISATVIRRCTAHAPLSARIFAALKTLRATFASAFAGAHMDMDGAGAAAQRRAVPRCITAARIHLCRCLRARGASVLPLAPRSAGS